jgi:hypothetical protein
MSKDKAPKSDFSTVIPEELSHLGTAVKKSSKNC